MKLEKLKGHTGCCFDTNSWCNPKFNANTPLRLAHFYHSVVMNQVSLSLLRKP
jgi:hypothetical protein